MGLALGLGSLASACDVETKPPGFEQLGGAGGAGATTASQSSTVASTHAVTSNASVTVTISASSSDAVSSSSGATCNDSGAEPNESEQQAVNLGNISDDDDDGDEISGVVDGAFDPDWYKYHGTDESITIVDPTRSLVTSAPIRMCKFFNCDNGEQAHFSCPSGSQSANSPDGRPGCCSMGGFAVDDFICGGSQFNSDSATVFIRIDNPSNNPCVSYTLKYHF